jgi:hypothetical protein
VCIGKKLVDVRFSVCFGFFVVGWMSWCWVYGWCRYEGGQDGSNMRKIHLHFPTRRCSNESSSFLDNIGNVSVFSLLLNCGMLVRFPYLVLVMPLRGMMAYGSKALLGRWGSPIPSIVGGFCDG